MRISAPGKYRKIKDEKEALDIAFADWKCVFDKMGGKPDRTLRRHANFLRLFEGCYAKCDGIIAKIIRVNVQSLFVTVAVDRGVCVFPLGEYFSIYLPKKP